jgi:hypothetical protein
MTTKPVQEAGGSAQMLSVRERLQSLTMDLEHPPQDVPVTAGELQHIDPKSLFEVTPSEREVLPHDEIFSDALDVLDTMKQEFGALDEEKRPELCRNRTFLGLPIDTVRSWINNAVVKNWVPAFFWNWLATKLDMDRSISRYAYISSTIQSFAYLKANKEELVRRIRMNDDPLRFFHKVTGLTYHPNYNEPEQTILAFDACITMFEEQYASAKRSHRLNEFFDGAFDSGNVCFEARVRQLQDYTVKATTEIDLEAVRNYTRESTMTRVLIEELRVFRYERHSQQGPMTKKDEFRQYLEGRHIFDIEARPEEGQEPRKFTKDDLDRIFDIFVNSIYIIGE